MSSGLPPILSAAPSAVNGFSVQNPFLPFPYPFPQFPNVTSTGQLTSSSGQNSSLVNRHKVKRHRQRVDAGEPRNTYQGTANSYSSSLVGTSSSSSSSSSTSSTASSTTSSNSISLTSSKQLPKTEETTLKTEEMRLATTSETTTGEQNQPETKTLESSSSQEDGGDDENLENEFDVVESEDVGERDDEEDDREESPASNSSSASKRKSFLPQKIGEQLGLEISDETEQVHVNVGGASSEEHEDVADAVDGGAKEPMTALQTQLQQNGSLFENQRRLYSSFIEQQRKQVVAAQNNPAAKVNFDALLSMLKAEVLTPIMKNFDKVVKDWMADELAKAAEAAPLPTPTAPFHPMFQPNPLFHLPTPHPMGAGGIFPPNLNAFNAFNAIRRTMQDAAESPEVKKKRARLDVKKEDISSRGSPLSGSASPPLGSSTPLSRYFPAPTMVGHPYGGMNFGGGDREDSPSNSDEGSDFGFDGNGTSSQLTPMHLRKAKLMFFYTRYPNSNLLKSYFPDIRFNKNNTAQLVKWFSNFREFYYIQMEKFGRQLLAEGIRDRSEIFVTKDSELFKVLNTHYNRNNHIKPPDRLVEVVQETLREFYDAIKQGKDSESSWKKTIYKVINRLDDQIPDFFKEPNFLERLES